MATSDMKSDAPQCSRCLSSTLEPSRRRGHLDRFMGRLGFRPMRCYTCKRRVYVRMAPIQRQSAAPQTND